MGLKLFLSSEQILNHRFAAVPKGYDPLDVDEYLDRIIADYRTVESNLLIKTEEQEALEKRIELLQNEIKRLQSQVEANNNAKIQIEQKRVEIEEKEAVDKKDYNDKLIKVKEKQLDAEMMQI